MFPTLASSLFATRAAALAARGLGRRHAAAAPFSHTQARGRLDAPPPAKASRPYRDALRCAWRISPATGRPECVWQLARTDETDAPSDRDGVPVLVRAAASRLLAAA